MTVSNQRRVEQINGREGETATFLSRCPLNFSGLGGISPHVISAVRLFVVKNMFHLNKQKIVISFVICLFLSATKVFACGCIGLPNETLEDVVKNSVKNSAMIFAGKVVGFEYRKGIANEFMQSKRIDYETKVVKFQVEQWWKGGVPKEIFLVTDETINADGTASNSSCNYNFKEGESYLVFAYGKEKELRTDKCSRTQPLNEADKDLKILGEGKKPLETKDEPNNSMDVRARAATFQSLINDPF